MNTNVQTNRPVLLVKSARWMLPAVLGFLLALQSRAADVPEPKTHTLFMGADISVEYNKTMYRVQSVVEGAVVINVGGKEVQVAADWSKVKLKVDRALKLTGTAASVLNLKGERAYTPGNDPWENYQKGLVKAELLHGESAFAQRVAQDARLSVELENVSQDPMGIGSAAHAKNLSKAIGKENAARSAGIGQGESTQHMGLEVEGQESFDAMRITFEISAETALNAPYVVILGQYHEKHDKPGTVANWFYAQPIPAITSDVRKVKILAGGLPPGFEIDSYQVHLYNLGREIATDVAPKRVALTREEAHTYARMEYFGSNKKASLPAKPFMGRPSKEARARLTPEQFDQPYYVKVTKEGLPIASFLDTNCSRPVDETVGSLIANVRFYPALEQGKAVEGVSELKLNQLVL